MNCRCVVLVTLLVALVATGCYYITGSKHMCLDKVASAFAWEDLNANGTRDEGEPPLAGVGIEVEVYGKEREYTAADGTWRSRYWVAGGCGPEREIKAKTAAECQSVHIHAFPPAGYRATTESAASGCYAEFGFVREVPFTPSAVPTATVLVTATVPAGQ